MRKLLIATGLLFFGYSSTPLLASLAQQEIPAYAKWSRLAINEAQYKYPNAKVIDYLYVGSETINDTTIATFQLWLKENDTEFGVIVKVTYKTNTEELISVEFKEFSRPVWKDV